MTNNGVADAANVQLTETFDTPLTVESITTSQGSCSGTICNLGTITAGQAPVRVDVRARAGNGFQDYPSNELLDNAVTVSAPVGTDINPDDNIASAAISTVPWAETSITKAFAPAQPVAGGPVTYTLTVHSDGPGTVDYVAADLLPAALQKPPAAISISGGTGVCRYDPTGESIGAADPAPFVVCDIPQLGPGEDRVITIQGTLSPDSARTEVANLALSSNTLPFAGVFSFEPDFNNNDDLVSFTPGTVDVGIEKLRVGSGTVPVGGEVVFRLVARNDGDAPGTGVEVRDTLPAGLTPVTADAGCAIRGQEVVCRIDALGPDAQQAFEVRARAEPAAAGQTLTNRATVTALAADPDPTDDASEAAVTIGPSPAAPAGQAPQTDLALRVIAPAGTHRVGDSTRWTIEITNVSQATARNVEVSGVAGGSARGTTARVSQTGCGPQPPVGCALGTLAPSERRTAVVRLTPVRPGTLTLSGNVTAAQAETRTDNNDDRARIRIEEALTTVSLAVKVPDTTPAAGAVLPITVTVRNRGTRPALGFRVCQRLPRGLGLLRRGGSTLRDGRVCWRIDRLAPGARRTLRITAHLSCVRARRTVITTLRGSNVRSRTARSRLRITCTAQLPRYTG